MGKHKPKAARKSSEPSSAVAGVLVAVLGILVAGGVFYLTSGAAAAPLAPTTDTGAERPADRRPPRDYKEVFAEAYQLYLNKDMAGSAAAFKEYLKIQPTDNSARNNLGLALTEVGELDEAIETFQQVVRKEPRHADAFSNLGIAFGKAGRAEESMEAYRKALAANPAHVNAANNLALALQTEERFDEAAAVLSSIIEKGGDPASLERSRQLLRSLQQARAAASSD